MNEAAPSPAVATSNAIDVARLSQELGAAVQHSREVHSSMTALIDNIVTRRADEPEKEILVIKDSLNHVYQVRSKLEKLGADYAKLKLNHVCAVPLGNTGFVNLDPELERDGFYAQLVNAYQLVKQMSGKAERALVALQASVGEPGVDVTGGNVSLLDLITKVKPDFPHLVFFDEHLLTNSHVQVTLPGVLQANLIFSGSTLCHAIALGLRENTDQQRPLKESAYAVFRKLSDVFQSVILRANADRPEVLLRKFLTRFSCYRTLFSAKCSVCDCYLQREGDGFQWLPPMWWSDDGKDVHHMSCR